MIAPATLVGCVRAETGIAQLVTPKRPMYQEAEGRDLRPLPR
jgi:hypothetical protein